MHRHDIRWTFTLGGLVVAGLLAGGMKSPAEVVINELLASNTVVDASGESPDWLELYNSGPAGVNLAGYALTDDKSEPAKWIFPPVDLPPLAYLLVFATGLDQRDPARPLQASFKLAREGEYLALRDPGGLVLDAFDPFPEQQTNVSYGREPDGSSTFRFFTQPTPGASNSTSTGPVAATPEMSPPAGVFPGPLAVTLTTSEATAELRYTLDGSIPAATSPLYAQPIALAQSTALRARAFREGYEASAVVTHSYLIRPGTGLPLMSLVTAPENLWDASTGIYVNAMERGLEWERPVSVEYFREDGARAFAENAGVRIHGGASRKRSEKKSFRLYFRSEYGASHLRYPLFSDTEVAQFDQILLRGGFQDSWTHDLELQRENATYVAEQTVSKLFLDMGYVAPHGTYVRLYLNGRYWGLYNLTERIREDFLEDYFGFSAWDMIDTAEVKIGDAIAWDRFRNFYHHEDLNLPANFETLQTMMELENFTHYVILNCWVQNRDWPGFNYVAVRDRRPGGRWKFIVWDAETSLGSGVALEEYRVDRNTLARVTAPSGNGEIGHLTRELIETDAYKTFFWERLQSDLDTVFGEEHVLQRLEEQVERVRPAIADEAIRWATDKSVQDWEEAVQRARDFVHLRTPILLEHVTELIGPAPAPPASFWQTY